MKALTVPEWFNWVILSEDAGDGIGIPVLRNDAPPKIIEEYNKWAGERRRAHKEAEKWKNY